MAVLSLATRLAGVLGVLGNGLLDGLLVGHLRGAHVGFHLEFAQQAVHDDLQMKLAHASNDGLTGFTVGVSLEGGVLLRQLDEGKAHLFLASLGFRLNGHPDDRLGELHTLKDNRFLFIAQGVAGGGVL
ncbi:hypothetical protein SDC9_195059 [bioreactor metagenome]|uniref:Uncharacterized protein n=1 Tax=bioreactor metagenome TaxID=1076179 RepID=A0A645I7Y2_9ZZZZ